MLNARKIDRKFFISGGWQDIERDTKWIKTENIRAILDVQYTNYDSPNVPGYIKNHLKDEDIQYEYILMHDGEGNDSLENIFTKGQEILTDWDNQFTNKKDRILIKCGAGVSRSVSQYLNYRCYRDSISFRDAYEQFRDNEDRWANIYADENFWPGMPSREFVKYISEKYPTNDSAFGEVVR